MVERRRMTKLEQLSEKADKIYLDLDGTLLASNEAMCKLLNRRYGLNHTGDEVTDWNYTNLYPTNAEEVEALYDSADFFRNVTFIKGARKYLTKYRKKIIIVTKASFKNYCHKKIFLRNAGFGDIPIIPLGLNMSKSLINMKGGLFIDDCTYNLKESNATYKLMFMEYDDGKDREWQRNWKRGKITEWS
jgi:5'(3')-deoxyribonucleotidase